MSEGFVLLVLVFVAFLYWLTNDSRNRRRSADPRVMACIVEHQAKLDLFLTANRLLLKTHPNRDDVAVLLRAAATHLAETSARELPETYAAYEKSLRGALSALLGE
ncbi:hypothetical protein [Ralstonia insidiosa]|uniref:hypothetical protein n=1 Tax=Ralstonia insidiosa TaxID=190721 RepID=UPI000CEDFE16|nr:hypothetical protein [Ralstonia insidiosa]